MTPPQKSLLVTKPPETYGGGQDPHQVVAPVKEIEVLKWRTATSEELLSMLSGTG
jgi:hypothetical protein